MRTRSKQEGIRDLTAAPLTRPDAFELVEGRRRPGRCKGKEEGRPDLADVVRDVRTATDASYGVPLTRCPALASFDADEELQHLRLLHQRERG